jgi:hypothetical protein
MVHSSSRELRASGFQLHVKMALCIHARCLCLTIKSVLYSDREYLIIVILLDIACPIFS